VQAPAPPNDLERALDGRDRALFEAIDDAVFVHDLEGNILEANPAACRRLGYTREELLRLTTRDVDEPSFAAGFGQRLRTQLTEGHYSCEGRHRTKDGRIIPVDINTSAIEINGKQAILAVMRDITERKQAEEALRKQTELLRSILDNMGDGVIVADVNGKFLIFNPAAERMFGLGLTDTPSQQWSQRYGLYLPDMVTPFPTDQLPLMRCIRGETVDEVELFTRHARAPEGIWCSDSGRPLRDERGAVKGGIVVCRDITERKRAERRQAAQLAVTCVLAESATLHDATPKILHAVCENAAWDMGIMWRVDSTTQMLHCVDLWHAPDVPLPLFEAMTQQIYFVRGSGLPGRVWERGEPVWIEDVQADDNFPRTEAAKAEGLHGAFAVPIRSSTELTGVLEFFSRQRRRPDAELLAVMAALGIQIGEYIERKRAERERDRFFGQALNLFCIAGFDGYLKRLNPAWETTFGYRPEELLGEPYLAFIHPDDRAATEAEAARLATGAVSVAFENRCRCKDGSYKWLLWNAVPFPEEEMIYAAGIDITERKALEESRRQYAQAQETYARELEAKHHALSESERRYRQLTEATLDGIIVADQGGRITLFNPAAEKLFGYRAEEVVGQKVVLLVPEEYREQHEKGLARYVQTRQSRLVGQTLELQGRRKDGSRFPMDLALSAIDLGGELQFLGAVRDLTERNRIRAILAQNEKLAAIGLLSAGVAHEINNPLAFVANNLAVLERDARGLVALLEIYQKSRESLARVDPDSARQAKALAEEIDYDYIRNNLDRLLSRTRDGVDRVTRIVHSLRSLARTDTPRQEEAHLPDLVENSLEIIRGRLRRRGIEVVQDYGPPQKVRCVATQLGQVVLNLLVNALQAIESASPAEGGRIRIATRRAEDEFILEVADNGCGIDPQHLPRLFDPFFTTKDVGEGTGLGLSISHNIVSGHGGRIEVDSELGKGSCFRIFLPLHPPRELA
jgi:PAS domain S-box-containing protein